MKSYSFLDELKTEAEITARWNTVKQPLSTIYNDWDTGDAWRYLLRDKLTTIIWGSSGQNVDRKTIPRTDARSVNDTVISFLSGNEPKISVEPSNPLHLGELDRSNFSEKLGLYTFKELDHYRIESLLKEVNDYAVHRGMIVGKNLWLSPEERGEVRSTPAESEPDDEVLDFDADEGLDSLLGEMPAIGDMAGELGVVDEIESADSGGMYPMFAGDGYGGETIEQEGYFPLCLDLIDPRECAWVLDTKGKVLELFHAFETTWDVLAATYPDFVDHKDFQDLTPNAGQGQKIRVLDCWDRTHNAVIVNGKFLKEPVEHFYPECPVVVEMINAERVRLGEGQYQLHPGPFCKPIYESLRWASWAESMSATHLARSTFMPLIHRGIKSDGSSPYTTIHEGADGSATVDYNATFDFSPDAGVQPAFDDEDFGYPQPPPIIHILQEFKEQRLRDISIVTFADGILSGLVKAELSGYSASLQTQAAMARIEPFKQGANRFLSRCLKMLFKIGYENWDRDEGLAFMLEAVAGEGEVEREITRDMLKAVGNVVVEIIPDVRVDRERESKELYEGLSLGVVSQLTVIDRLGHVQDPQAELERIAFEKVSSDPNHPMFMQASGALADNYMKKNKLGPYSEDAQQQPPPPPQEPPPMDPMAAMAGMDPALMGGQMPMDPAMAMGGGMPPGPPMGPDPMMGGGPPPMDPMMLQQLLGGGD